MLAPPLPPFATPPSPCVRDGKAISGEGQFPCRVYHSPKLSKSSATTVTHELSLLHDQRDVLALEEMVEDLVVVGDWSDVGGGEMSFIGEGLDSSDDSNVHVLAV
jgi:hypothetical protein